MVTRLMGMRSSSCAGGPAVYGGPARSGVGASRYADARSRLEPWQIPIAERYPREQVRHDRRFPIANSKPDTISIARREGVAALDAFIGPKA